MDFMEIQRNIASRLASETQMDKTVEVLSTIQSLRPDREGKIAIEDVIIEASYKGLTENEVLGIIDQLTRNGTLRQKDGYVSF